MTHILLVEDNPIDARLMQHTFTQLGGWATQVTWIDDGQKALWFLQSLEHGGVEQPLSAAIVDLNLPRYNGLRVLEAFRNSSAARNLPIFLFSSSPVEEIQAIAEQHLLPASGYFEKPWGLEGYQEIAAKMRNYLEISARGLSALASISEARTAALQARTRSAHP